MSLIRLNRHPSSRQLLVFAFAWLVVLGLLGLAQWRHGRPTFALVGWSLAVGVPLVGAAWKEGLRLLFVSLSYATYPIGLVVSSVVLVALYYLVLTPIVLVLRLCHYDPLQRRFDRAAASYWQPRVGRRAPASYFRQH
jgi:hypothetical protein